MADDYYAILGVDKDATSQDIKKAFRQIARECHPDRSGGDAASEERFKKSRQAYETLMDPVTRARYDRRGQRQFKKGESFFDAFYRHTGGGNPAPTKQTSNVRGRAGQDPTGRRPTKKRDAGNDVSLDDLFNDFGFGGGRVNPGARAAPPPRKADTPPPSRGRPTPGDDVHIDIDVPSRTAGAGGSVTAVYHRMQRMDSWRPGMGDPGLVRVQDIADVRIIPGSRTGEVLREKGLGNAGAHGGPYGDLVARIRVVRSTTAQPPPPDPAPAPAPERDPTSASASSTDRNETVLDISVVEALLGGRVPLETSHGAVRLSIPPGSSGGSKLRLKGKGPPGDSGQPTDLYVTLRVVVPRNLDAESRELIEQFARLNPDLAR